MPSSAHESSQPTLAAIARFTSRTRPRRWAKCFDLSTLDLVALQKHVNLSGQIGDPTT